MDPEQQPQTAYVLGHSDHELERLISQAQFYEPFTMQFFEDAGVTAGMRVLDVGSGSGDVSFLAARMVGSSGQVVGVERAPIAVETAKRRAADLHISNTEFVLGDAATMTFEEPFDAVVGRFVLQFCPDPSAVVRQLAKQVRPGGIIAFQEVDWAGCHALPESLTLNQCVRWGSQALQQSGAEPYTGLKLPAIFTGAGLPYPRLSLRAAIGAGPDDPVYSSVAALIHTLLPTIEQLGIASAEEVGVETLAARLSAEVTASNGTIIWVYLIGAVARTPSE